MPNKGRGEIEFEVGGRSYILRPSFETLAAIEDATDKGAAELLLSVNTLTQKVKHVVATLWVAAKRSGNGTLPGLNEFGELIRSDLGMAAASSIMREFLSIACCSDKQIAEAEDKENEDEDETEAPPSKPSEEAAS